MAHCDFLIFELYKYTYLHTGTYLMSKQLSSSYWK